MSSEHDTLADATNTQITMETDATSPEKVASPEKKVLFRKRANSDNTSKENEETTEAPTKKQRLLRPSSVTDTRFAAPVLWEADAGVDGRALLVDKERCIMGTNDGRVIILNHSGEVQKQWLLYGKVGAIFQDGGHLYAWCHAHKAIDEYKGSLYEILEDEVIHHFDLVDFGELVNMACMYNGCLVLGDHRGSLAVLNIEGEFIWQKTETQANKGLLHVDSAGGIYLALTNSVRKYDVDSGALFWEYGVSGMRNMVKSAAVHGDRVYVEMDGQVVELDTETGNELRTFSLGRHRKSGIVVGGGYLITGSCPTLIFDLSDGKEVYTMNFAGRLEDAVSVLHAESGCLFSFWDRLYCIDLSEVTVQRTLAGKTIFQLSIRIPKVTTLTEMGQPETADKPLGPVVQCLEIEGNIMARAQGPEYDGDKFVAVPLAWREAGRCFTVEELEDCSVANCYRPRGKLRQLPDAVQVTSPKSQVIEQTASSSISTSPKSTPPDPITTQESTTPTPSPQKAPLNGDTTPTPSTQKAPLNDDTPKSITSGETMLTPQFSSITIPNSPDAATPVSCERKKRRRTGNFLPSLALSLENASPTKNEDEGNQIQ